MGLLGVRHTASQSLLQTVALSDMNLTHGLMVTYGGSRSAWIRCLQCQILPPWWEKAGSLDVGSRGGNKTDTQSFLFSRGCRGALTGATQSRLLSILSLPAFCPLRQSLWLGTFWLLASGAAQPCCRSRLSLVGFQYTGCRTALAGQLCCCVLSPWRSPKAQEVICFLCYPIPSLFSARAHSPLRI